MSTNKLPPVSPKEILVEEWMKPLGMTIKELATALGTHEKRLEALMDSDHWIDLEMANRLAFFTGMTNEFWMTVQADFDKEIERQWEPADKLSKENDSDKWPEPPPQPTSKP